MFPRYSQINSIAVSDINPVAALNHYGIIVTIIIYSRRIDTCHVISDRANISHFNCTQDIINSKSNQFIHVNDKLWL